MSRKDAARKHATRRHICPGCGKLTHGNGGRSSHQRACQRYTEWREKKGLPPLKPS